MMYEKCLKSAEYIISRCGNRPEIAVFIGSGLSDITELLDDAVVIPYADIPNFPAITNKAHKGEMYIGKISGKTVAFMSGRFHCYEGYSFAETAIPVRVLKLAGVNTLILTNAAGGVNTSFNVGDIMLINDHIKFTLDSPENGIDDEEFGCRFFGMNNAYSKRLGEMAHKIADRNNIALKDGIYFYMAGPQYETPAEIRAIRMLGGDAAGMSTVGEAITAARLGMETVAFSCITNLAAGMSETEPNDDEVVENGKLYSGKLKKLICGIIEQI